MRLGFTLPTIILLFFLTDLSLRFLPVELFAFRGIEVLTRYGSPDGTMEPNRRYHNPQSYGEQAAMANLPGVRQYRSETMSTDPYGYRNASGLVAAGPPAAVAVGSSFTLGVGVSDDETLPAQLTALSGRPVYNGALLWDAVGITRIQTLVDQLGMRRGLLILEWLDWLDVPWPLDPPRRIGGRCERELDAWNLAWVCGEVAGWFNPSWPVDGSDPRRIPWRCEYRLEAWNLAWVCGKVQGFKDVSPLQILAGRVYKSLQDDRWLPNTAAGTVVQRRLRNGEVMLFTHEETEAWRPRRSEEASVQYLSRLAGELAKLGLDLLVVIVPSKYAVYEPLLEGAEEGGDTGPLFAERLESRLRQMGIPVLNLTPDFLTRGATDLDQGRYLFWRDDHHWNARGIALGTGHVCQMWTALAQERSIAGPLAC